MSSSITTTSPQAAAPIALPLLPIMVAVLASFLIVGVALPVLPLHVEHDLGFGTFVVGLVAGSQFAASLLSRVWAGRYADARGAKPALVLGLSAAAVSGLFYLLSLVFLRTPAVSAGILLLGRGLLGGAESLIITGGMSWGLAIVDTRSAGRVIAWIGMAMFIALAAGGPVGTFLYARGGFSTIGVVTTLLPLAVLAMLALIPGAPRAAQKLRADYRLVLRNVWLPGLGAALSSVGYGAVLAFSSLLFANRQWHPVWLGFTAFGAALILARLFFGNLPDRRGGASVAFCFVFVEAAGLVLIGFSQGAIMATAGAALAGLGYSLVYPGLGAEAVRSVPPENRGVAMGIYTAFLDLALGLGTPALGWIADIAGLGRAFLASAVVVLAAAAVAAWLAAKSSRGAL